MTFSLPLPSSLLKLPNVSFAAGERGCKASTHVSVFLSGVKLFKLKELHVSSPKNNDKNTGQ